MTRHEAPTTATQRLAHGELRTRILRLHRPRVRVGYEVVDEKGAVIHRASYRARRAITARGALAEIALDLLDDAQREVFVRRRPDVDHWADANGDELIAVVVEHATGPDPDVGSPS